MSRSFFMRSVVTFRVAFLFNVQPTLRVIGRGGTFFVLACLLCCSTKLLHAEITVDPENVGATDVFTGVSSSNITPLTNPVADPLDIGMQFLLVGNTTDGSLSITDGGQLISPLSTASFIGFGSGSNGVVTVDGPDSAWIQGSSGSFSRIWIGYYGHGELHITNGAVVSDAIRLVAGYREGSSGILNIQGAGSQLSVPNYQEQREPGDPNIGRGTSFAFYGEAEVNVLDGGFLETSSVDIGVIEGSHGIVNLDGDSSKWSAWEVQLLRGEIHISNGAQLFSKRGGIGNIYGHTSTNAVVTVDGFGSIWESMNGISVGGNSREDTLSIQNGGAIISSGIGSIDNYGQVSVEGFGSSWNMLGDMFVGFSRTANLSIQHGGFVSNVESTIGWKASSSGHVTVENFGSSWISNGTMVIAKQGIGTLEIRSAGAVTSGEAIIGQDAGSLGSVELDGTRSRWGASGDITVGGAGEGVLTIQNNATLHSSGKLIVGQEGIGTLTIHSGGSTYSPISQIGQMPDSIGVVTLEGSQAYLAIREGTFFEQEAMLIGNEGNGTLNILQGAKILDTGAYIGYAEGSNGLVRVSGIGSEWGRIDFNTIRTEIGYEGNGKLIIQNGASVVASLTLGAIEGSYGEVIVEGEGTSLNNRSPYFQIGGPADLDIGEAGAGKLVIRDGAHVDTGNVYIGREVDSEGMVIVEGEGAVLNFPVFSYSSLRVGVGGTGTLIVRDGGRITNARSIVFGNGKGSRGTLEIGFGTAGPPLIEVEQSMSIRKNSTLIISIGDDILLTEGEEHVVVTTDRHRVIGTFTNEQTLAYNNITVTEFDVIYENTSIALEVLSSTLLADFNEDGIVDGADFLAWQDGFGTQSIVEHSDGDANGDGIVDGRDFLVWQNQFGLTMDDAMSQLRVNEVVPEPEAWLLGVIFMLSFCIYRNPLC